MKTATQFGTWLSSAALMLALVVPALTQNRRNDQRSAPRPNRQEQHAAPRPNRQESRPSRPEGPRHESPRHEAPRPENHPQPQFQQPRNDVPRPYQPPAQGHHSGQWLNQHRELPLDQ